MTPIRYCLELNFRYLRPDIVRFECRDFFQYPIFNFERRLNHRGYRQDEIKGDFRVHYN